MKFLKTFTTLVLFAVALFWTACKKEVSQQATMNQNGQVSQDVKQFGAVKDDQNTIGKVQLIVSPQFLDQENAGTLIEAGSKRRPPNGGGGGGSDVTPPSIS